MKKFVTLALLSLAVVGQASTIRHDRNDADYLALGAAFPSVGAVVNGGSLGSGTYIGFGNGSHWALTAGHVAAPGDPADFFINGGFTGVTQVISFAGWNLNFNDFSLLRLASNPGVAAMPYYNGALEQGRDAVSVGYGATGTGLTGINAGAGTKRGFENVIDLIQVNGNTNAIFTDFDNPNNSGDNWFGSATPRNLEGNVAGGDSGGGLIANFGTTAVPIWRLVGVTSTLIWQDGNGNADYGDGSGYSRIGGNNAGANWIASNTGIQGVPEPGTMLALGAGLAALVARRRRKA